MKTSRMMSPVSLGRVGRLDMVVGVERGRFNPDCVELCELTDDFVATDPVEDGDHVPSID